MMKFVILKISQGFPRHKKPMPEEILGACRDFLGRQPVLRVEGFSPEGHQGLAPRSLASRSADILNGFDELIYVSICELKMKYVLYVPYTSAIYIYNYIYIYNIVI